MEKRNKKLEARLKRQHFLAKYTLVLERSWNASAPLFWVIGVFLSITAFGFWQWSGTALHIVFLILLLLGLVAGLVHFSRVFHWPQINEILKNLEQKNNLSHRPLRSMDAEISSQLHENETSRELWEHHQQQQKQALLKVKAFWPDLTLGNGDFFSLRPAVLLLILTSVILGGGGLSDKLKSAFIFEIFEPLEPVQADVWVSPPEYTGLPPRLLITRENQGEIRKKEVFKVPAGSSLIVRVSGGNEDPPVLTNGPDVYEFSSLDKSNFSAEITALSGGLWRLIKDSEAVAVWDLQIIPDLPPIVNMQDLPLVTDRKALQLTAASHDDYGIDSLTARISRNNTESQLALKLPFIQGAKKSESKSYHDLTDHMWAGLPVELQIQATDEMGQVGLSKVIRLTLPERIFAHPVARVLIGERKTLVADPDRNKLGVASVLNALSSLPRGLDDDWTVHLYVSASRAILLSDMQNTRVEEVSELLWQAALRLEDGDLVNAERELRAAENALMEALNNGAEDAEIKRLVENLKDAMQEFLAELSKEQSKPQDQLPSITNGQQLQSEDLNNLLDKLDELARSGARAEARDLLRQLQDIMENLQAANAAPSAEQTAGQKLLDDLDKVMGGQQQLMDETLKSSQRLEPSGKTSDKNDGKVFRGLSAQQEALRQMLGDIMGELGLGGTIPDSFGKAERAMNAARQALELQQPKAAEAFQKQVMEQLRQGSQNIVQQFMQGQSGQGMGQFGSDVDRDPLGRPLSQSNGKALQNSDHDLISKSTPKMIMEEVRRRLADPNRPTLEKQYLKRLLERFR